ncbi:MAG: peptidoglycan DD-metalloendopeptidase family protein [Anaerolineae bacterium]|nr:peptidoglycan DD-metalloendopeptidase family protein [Anaerolineae bacterium]
MSPTPTIVPPASPTATVTAASSPAAPTATAALTRLLSTRTPTLTVTTPLPTARPSATARLSPSPTATPRPPTATPAPIQPGRLWPTADTTQVADHYWLARPFAPDVRQWPDPTYLYGSTARGRLRAHHGIDIPNAQDTPVLAVAPAVVLFAGRDADIAFGPQTDFYGQLVILRLDQRYGDRPLYVPYGHLSAIYVREGEHVDTGQPLGAVGMTGIAMGPHLHLEVRLGANDYESTRNPGLWLEPLPGHGTLAGRLLDAEGRTLPEASVLIYSGGDEEHLWRVVTVYADDPGLHPDDRWGENFLLADVPAGRYRLAAQVDGRVVSQQAVVEEGQTTFVDLTLRRE